MESYSFTDNYKGGFDFSNCARNEQLLKDGFLAPKAIKTGTTIVGIAFKNGVILGADTRATEGPIVADKNCEKIHYLAPNMYCCGAGTAADTEMVTNLISSNLKLLSLNTGRTVQVRTANTLLKQYLFRYQGHVSAALVLGGVDNTGFYIYSIYPHGSTDKLPYASMGSGSLAAMSVLETKWTKDMSEEDGKILVSQAITAGITNDLGSGSCVDLVVITNKGAEVLRNYINNNKKGVLSLPYRFPRNSTALHPKYKIEVTSTTVTPIQEIAMETA